MSVQTGQETTRQMQLVLINYWNTETEKIKNLPLHQKLGNNLSCSCDQYDGPRPFASDFARNSPRTGAGEKPHA